MNGVRAMGDIKGFSVLFQEFAGLGGDVRFLKHNLEYQQSLELLQDVVNMYFILSLFAHFLAVLVSNLQRRCFSCDLNSWWKVFEPIIESVALQKKDKSLSRVCCVNIQFVSE